MSKYLIILLILTFFTSCAEEDKEIIIPVQVNGKMRGTIVISSSATKEEVEKKALSSEKIKQYIGGKNYTVIYVSGKILNFVVR